MKNTLIILLFTSLLIVSQQFETNEFVRTDLNERERDVIKYWTPERMKRAKPFMPILEGNTTDSDFASKTEEVPYDEYSNQPYKVVGKVFFSSGGNDYVCSASASGNNAVLTAGHCVSDGQGHWHSRWIFFPGYYKGHAPHGAWVARSLLSFRSWHSRGDLSRDVGYAVVNSRNGKSLEQVVGKLEMRFSDVGDNVIAIGYPVPIFGGDVMVRTIAKIRYRNKRFNPASVGIKSKMKGGCSGGPWASSDKLAAVGLNSYAYRGEDTLYSPGFDEYVIRLRSMAISMQ